MSRIRTVKPQLFKHEALFDAERESGLPLRVAFIGLLCQCDREGRFRWQVRTLKSDVLPFDDVDFSRVLDALTTRGFVLRYECNGEIYGAIPTFRKHQTINNRESLSEIPPPPEAPPDKPLTRAPRVPHTSGACTSGRGIRKGNKERKEKHTACDTLADSAARFDAHAHLVSLGANEKIVADWLAVRKRKKAESTETAIAGVVREAAKAGMSLDDVLRLCCEKNWAGFGASWLESMEHASRGTHNGAPLDSLDGPALDALARELGIDPARVGESMRDFHGRIKAAQNRRGLH